MLFLPKWLMIPFFCFCLHRDRACQVEVYLWIFAGHVGFFHTKAHFAMRWGSHLQNHLTNSRTEVHENIVRSDLNLVNHLRDEIVRCFSVNFRREWLVLVQLFWIRHCLIVHLLENVPKQPARRMSIEPRRLQRRSFFLQQQTNRQLNWGEYFFGIKK